MSAHGAWPLVPLRELCIDGGQYGTSEKSSTAPTGLPVLRMGNLVDGEIDWSDLKYLAASSREAAKCSLQKGDLLFNRTNSVELVGKSAVFNDDRDAVFASYLVRFRMKADRADPHFVCAYINSEFGRAFIDANMVRAIGQANVSASTMQRMEIPAPSLQEQRRVAARLREQLAIASQARTALKQQLTAVRDLPASHLRGIFRSASSDKWVRLCLGDVADITGGVTLGRDLRGRSTRAVPYLRVANVKDGWLDLTQIKQTEATEKEIAALRLKKGDLLLTEGGDPDKLGRGTYWSEQIAECIHQNHIFRVRLPSVDFDPRFVAWQLGSAYGKDYFLRHAKQTTGIATINRRVLDAFPLLSPSLEVQQAIAAQLEGEFLASADLQRAVAQRLLELDKLAVALLRAAFDPASTAGPQVI